MSDRIADALERIADALEKAHAAYMDIEASNRPAEPCDDRTCTDRDHWAPLNPNRCDPGCTRPSLHDGDCVAADPLDEDDHRPRHDSTGDHWYRRSRGGWAFAFAGERFALAEVHALHGPLTFCDCANPEGDPMTIDTTTTHTGKA